MALISNKNAFRNYEVIETYEAGLVLTGTEVKSISHSQGSINESYITIKKNEAFIFNMYVAPFEQGNQFNVDPNRLRKLLLHKREIIKLEFKSQKDGLTIIPIKIYWKNNKIKLEIALAKGKKLFDKREDIKKRDLKRESLKY
ncbi:MAG: SsrA-binding protein SmpB [Candidatus Ureaplasma intestinipullorum]|uniref:SsrA-binding protein n=1 Tax=Candidatus Ureaplasma intestinipullorum TaxID=2838770 RepID=A0A9E2NVW5_9BACT|nr:SsrA-binding protein SmpB [Candidatus Ureaplasma intestinipullorum]